MGDMEWGPAIKNAQKQVQFIDHPNVIVTSSSPMSTKANEVMDMHEKI